VGRSLATAWFVEFEVKGLFGDVDHALLQWRAPGGLLDAAAVRRWAHEPRETLASVRRWIERAGA